MFNGDSKIPFMMALTFLFFSQLKGKTYKDVQDLPMKGNEAFPEGSSSQAMKNILQELARAWQKRNLPPKTEGFHLDQENKDDFWLGGRNLIQVII